MANNYGTRQNNEKENEYSVNTKCYTFMNSKSEIDPSALTIGSWNDMLSIRLNPTLEPSKQTENRVFDYEKSVSTSLTKEKAILMLYKINKKILPAIESSTDTSVGVQVGGDSLLVVGCKHNNDGNMTSYLGLFKSLNPDTMKPEMSMAYEFKSEICIENYDENNGSYTVDNDTFSELNLFIMLLKSFIVVGNGFTAHSMRYVDKFYRDRVLNTTIGIAEKVGAPTGSSSYGSRSSRTTNIFGNNNNSSTNNTSTDDDAETLPFNDINDLSSMIND